MLVRQLFILLTLCLMISCGKKSSLDRHPGSDFPKSYPKSND